MRVLITGASMGIGEAFANVFAEHGHDLVLVARSERRMENLAEKLRTKFKVAVDVIALDLSKMENIDTLVARLQGQPIDCLVNNAGFGAAGEFTKTDWSREHEMIELNISALTYLTKIFAGQMKERRQGRILNVASTAAFQPGPRMAVYFATKAYVLSFTEAVAHELKGSGVTLTALCPGPTSSNFVEAAQITTEKIFNSGTMPTAEEVARYGYQSVMAGKTVAIHGWMNLVLAQSNRLTPRRWVRAITGWLLRA